MMGVSQWQEFKGPRKVRELALTAPVWPRSRAAPHGRTGCRGLSDPAHAAGLCPSGQGETMRLFLPICSDMVLTLRALMGWLPWEPERPSYPMEREAPS